MPVSTDVKLSNMSFVILYVKDTAKTLSFYKNTLGMEVINEDPGWVELKTGETTLCLHSEPDASPDKAGPTIVCFTVDDIQATYEALKAKGVKFDKEPHVVCEAEGKSGKSADFRDPDGHRLSIFGWAK